MNSRTVVFLLACMLFVSSISIYYGLSASTPTSGLTDIYIEPPMMEPSYIIGYYNAFYDVNTLCYLKNGTTGQIVTTANFYTCLHTAVDALTDGGKILIRAGTYYLTTLPILVLNSAVYIEGEGEGNWEGTNGTKIKYYLSSSGGSMFYFLNVVGNHNFFGGLSKITLQGNFTPNSYGVVIGGFVSDLLFEDCGIFGFDSGVVLKTNSYANSKIWNIWFSRCSIESNLNYGIYFTQTYDIPSRYIDRVKISECHFSGNKNSVYCDTPYVYHVTFTDNTVQAELQACINVSTGGRQWVVSDNHIFDCGIGANGTMAAIMINGTSYFYPDAWLIEGNIIANHWTAATNNSVWLTGTVREFSIQNNYFYVTGEGVRLSNLNVTINPLLVIDGNVGTYNNTVTSWNMGFGAEPSSASYVIFKDSSLIYMMNGTTGYVDYQSTNATQVHNFAFGNLTSGGTVFTKAGTYTISGASSKILIGSNTTWIGEGQATVIVLPASSTFVTGSNTGHITNLHAGTDTDINIYNIRFDGDFDHQTNNPSCLAWDGVTRWRVEGCYFTNHHGYPLRVMSWLHQSPYGIFQNNFVNHTTWGCIWEGNINYAGVSSEQTINSNYFGDAHVAVSLWGGSRITISNNVFDDVYNEEQFPGESHVAIGLEGTTTGWCDHITVVGNTINGSEVGILSTEYVKDSIFSSNTIYDQNDSYCSIELRGQGMTVIGNTMQVARRGIEMSNLNDSIISNNVFRGMESTSWGGRGIDCEGSVNRISIIGNSFVDVCNEGIDIQYAMTNSTISNNRFFNSRLMPRAINIYSATAHYNRIFDNSFFNVSTAIKVWAGPTSTTIESNYFRNCGTPIDNSGTTTLIRWNDGYKTEASGSLASCINGTAIPHGMVTTPQVLTLCLHGPTAYNATMILCAPTILSVNATHMVIEFVMWETVTWTLVPVTAVEAQTVWWTAQTWNYP